MEGVNNLSTNIVNEIDIGKGVGSAIVKSTAMETGRISGDILGSMPSSNSLLGDIGRGGVFVYMKRGENLEVQGEGDPPRPVGTWFALNYPCPPQVQVSEK